MLASSGVMIWVMNDRTTKAPRGVLPGPGNGGKDEKQGAWGRVVVCCAFVTASLSLLIARQGRSARTRDVVGVRACAVRAMRPTARGHQHPGVSEPWWVASRPVQQARQHHSKLPR